QKAEHLLLTRQQLFGHMFGNLLALCCPGFETLGSRFIPLVCDSPGGGYRGGNARHPIKPVCPQLLLSFRQGLDHRFSLLSPLHGVPPKLLHPMFSPTRPISRRRARMGSFARRMEPFPNCYSYDFLLACPAVFNHSVWAVCAFWMVSCQLCKNF